MRTGNVQRAFEESLHKLGTDYADLYLLHWPAGDYVKSWLDLEKIYKAGHARAIGVCNFQPHHLEDIKKVWSVVPAINQIELHPELTQKPLRKICDEFGIVVTAYSPLGGPNQAAQMLQNPTIAEISKKYNKTPAQIVLRWNIDIGITTIPKSSNTKRLAENFDVFDFSLSPQDISEIEALNKNKRVGYDPDNFDF